MSIRELRRALAGAALVLPVIGGFLQLGGYVGLAHATPLLSKDAAKQGPFAANRTAARALTRDTGADRAPTVGETYPHGRTQSPLTTAVAARLRAIAARGERNPHVFSKVGASATVNRNYLRCFAGDDVDLAGRDHLRATLEHFRAGQPNPFLRRSEAATVGWHAGRAVWGRHPPLNLEVRHVDPRFAVVMYGTNDIELGRPEQYAELMLRLTHMLERRGVVPILSTIMPRDDDPDADEVVSLYNAIVRGIAQLRRLPMIDYHRELARLPDHGLASDRLHPNVHFDDGDPRGCDFSDLGLTHGYNLRNLITLEALDRARRVLLEGEGPLDAPAAAPSGRGTFADPIQAQLPFAHASDTRRAAQDAVDEYRGCDADQDESGPEVVYRVHLDEPAEITAMVVTEGAVDVDLHVMHAVDGAPACEARADGMLTVDLDAGEHWFVVDTFVSQGGVDQDATEHAGEFLFVAARTDRPSDPTPPAQ